MTILLKLFLAHMLGDFILQPDSWVKAKERHRLASWQLYAHTGIHFILIMILVWDLEFWKWALPLAVVHLIIDIAKLYLQTGKKRLYFFLDQMVHILIICLVWIIYKNTPLTELFKNIDYYIVLITFSYAVTQPASVLISLFISRWTPESKDAGKDSLSKAGNWIGIFERLFVFAFVLSGTWEAIGFLLAAKSIFRFGDLKESKDRKLTEYVLIGTLLSFGIAIIAGLIFLKVKVLV